MSDKYTKGRLNQHELTGIVSDWAIITLAEDNIFNLDGKYQAPYTFLIGDIDIDFKGRFRSGNWFRSSLVTDFDETDFVATTMNSCYQLNGAGFKMVADFKFIDLFMHRGFRVRHLIECCPSLVIEYTHFEATSQSVH